MPLIRNIQRIPDLIITLLLWVYFIGSAVVFFLLFYMPAYFFAAKRAAAYQYLNHMHMKGFFAMVRLLAPRTSFQIPKEVQDASSSIIICNHLSYLDPILLISLWPRQCTIVKSTFFKVPFFGCSLKASGYVPSASSEMLGPAMIKNLESIKKHLAAGHNLFIFPEGTRSRNGKLAPFNRGVFSIARYCEAPLKIVYIKNTNKLFPPGSFLFNTRDFNVIELELIGTLLPDYKNGDFSINALGEQVRAIFEQRMAER